MAIRVHDACQAFAAQPFGRSSCRIAEGDQATLGSHLCGRHCANGKRPLKRVSRPAGELVETTGKEASSRTKCLFRELSTTWTSRRHRLGAGIGSEWADRARQYRSVSSTNRLRSCLSGIVILTENRRPRRRGRSSIRRPPAAPSQRFPVAACENRPLDSW